MNVGKKKESRLVELWNRRATLNEQEWRELYVLVKNALSGKFLTIIKDLRIDQEECIQDFFEDKVFALNQHKHKIYHSGAVSTYYERYLISRLRDPYVKSTIPLVAQGENDGENRYLSIDDAVALEGASGDADSIDTSEGIRLSADELISPDVSSGNPDNDEQEEANSGHLEIDDLFLNNISSIDELKSALQGKLDVDIEKIQKSAIDFLYGKGEWSRLANHREWIQLYLRCHFCPDGETQEVVPLYKLAKEHQIPSHHIRAVKLGITWPKKKGTDAVLESFRLSYLGKWLISRGIPVDPEHQIEMALALKILCLEALKLQRPC